MLDECINIFKKTFNDIDKIIIDGYIPAEGTYIIVQEDNNGELKIKNQVEIEVDKKTKDIDRTVDKFYDICKYDYNSKLIDMNKPIDPKKIIHSNNFLSFFVKKESFQNKKLTNEVIDGYYEVLRNPLLKYLKKIRSKELYEEAEESIGSVDLIRLEKINIWIKENIFKLDIDKSKKNYLKIFFLFSDDDFVKEGNRYLIPNIYNNNDFNIKKDNQINGIPNNNIGMNSKKPYLENKTRKIKVPYLLNREEVLEQKKFFDYLYNLASQGKNIIYFGDSIKAISSKESLQEDFSGYYLRIQKGKEVEIHDFDIIAHYSNKLENVFLFKNYLDIDYEKLYSDKSTFEYGKKHTIDEVKYLINNILFSNYLINSLFLESLNIKDTVLEKTIFKTKDKFIKWFYKGSNYGLWGILDKESKIIIKSTIEKDYITKARNQFNLRYSLKEFFNKGEDDMADILKSIKNELREKINNKKDSYINSDEEYFFSVGQLAYYLLNKSNGKNKPMSMLNPIINGKKDKVIKTKLKQLFKKYNYDLDMNRDLRIKKLYEMIIGYEVEDKINDDLIIAGYLSNNIMFEKKED